MFLCYIICFVWFPFSCLRYALGGDVYSFCGLYILLKRIPPLMGISVWQWRYSIGLFSARSLEKVEENFNPIQLSFNLLCHVLGCMVVKLLLCKVFVHCSMIISFAPLFLFLYPFFHLFSYQIPSVNYFVYFFFKLILLPWCISTSFWSIYSFFNSQFTEIWETRSLFL